jgi:hypothetical protein
MADPKQRCFDDTDFVRPEWIKKQANNVNQIVSWEHKSMKSAAQWIENFITNRLDNGYISPFYLNYEECSELTKQFEPLNIGTIFFESRSIFRQVNAFSAQNYGFIMQTDHHLTKNTKESNGSVYSFVIYLQTTMKNKSHLVDIEPGDAYEVVEHEVEQRVVPIRRLRRNRGCNSGCSIQ